MYSVHTGKMKDGLKILEGKSEVVLQVHNRFQINQISAYHSQRKCYMSLLRRDD